MNRQSLSNTIHFALDSAFQYPEHPFGQDIYLGINVPREALGLELGRKPGDIDYLVVPVGKSGPMVDRSIAIEAKVVRPTLKNPDRNANSFGRKQVLGLLSDGFPFVGLLHIVVPEPLPDELHWQIPMIDNKLGPDGKLQETGQLLPLDPFPVLAAGKQESRLLAFELPDTVGYKVISFQLSQDGQSFSGNTVNESRRGSENPQMCTRLQNQIGRYLRDNPNNMQRVSWYGEADG